MVLKFVLSGWAALLIGITAAAVDADPEVHLDATKGNPGDREIIYLIVADPKISPQKTVAVILRASGKEELIYAYQVRDGAVTLGLIAYGDLPADKKKGVQTSTTTVRVTPGQYDKAKEIIESHAALADTSDSPEIRFYNCICEVLRTCTMKIPYRSPYRPPNLVQWVGDIPAYSRDIVAKD